MLNTTEMTDLELMYFSDVVIDDNMNIIKNKGYNIVKKNNKTYLIKE